MNRRVSSAYPELRGYADGHEIKEMENMREQDILIRIIEILRNEHLVTIDEERRLIERIRRGKA